MNIFGVGLPEFTVILILALLIFRSSLPVVSYINNWIENKTNKYDDSEFIDTDSVPLDD